jgi:hypothetical protein
VEIKPYPTEQDVDIIKKDDNIVDQSKIILFSVDSLYKEDNTVSSANLLTIDNDTYLTII